MADATEATAKGAGQVTFAAGGIVHGKGTITHPDGTVQEFEMTSDPLTHQQAEQLNQKED